jgi:hypothetical protein
MPLHRIIKLLVIDIIQSHELKDCRILILNVIFLENYVLSPTVASVKEVAYVSTFPPKKCGIATFTSDLVNSINQLKTLKAQRVISIDGGRLLKSADESSGYNIGREFLEEYVLMADVLNHSSVNVVIRRTHLRIFR